jgi:hypothetical protein
MTDDFAQQDRDSVIWRVIDIIGDTAFVPDRYRVIAALNHLLRPDPAEASEPLSGAEEFGRPARSAGTVCAFNGEAGNTDHSGYAETFDDAPFVLCERTIRHCIDVLGGLDGMVEARAALQSLLPTPPDPAKALVDSYQQKLGCYLTDGERATLNGFAEMLITEGRIG